MAVTQTMIPPARRRCWSPAPEGRTWRTRPEPWRQCAGGAHVPVDGCSRGGKAMDGKRFDGLIRALGSGTSRRGVVGLLAAAAGLGMGEVMAKARHRRKGKGRGKGKRKGKQQAQDKPKKCVPNNKCAQWCA